MLGTKETYGPSTRQICKQCMLMQPQLRSLDLSKSYLNSQDPPCQIRTTAVHAAQVARVEGEPDAKARQQLAMNFGLDMADSKHVVKHAMTNVPGGEYFFDLLSVEIQHDVFLGPAEQIVLLTLTHMTRDVDHPNHFSHQQLMDRHEEYPWAAVSRADRPEPFMKFPTHLKSTGKGIYGDAYDGWIIPNLDHSLKWTAGEFTMMMMRGNVNI
jgi:hypothetical protein